MPCAARSCGSMLLLASPAVRARETADHRRRPARYARASAVRADALPGSPRGVAAGTAALQRSAQTRCCWSAHNPGLSELASRLSSDLPSRARLLHRADCAGWISPAAAGASSPARTLREARCCASATGYCDACRSNRRSSAPGPSDQARAARELALERRQALHQRRRCRSCSPAGALEHRSRCSRAHLQQQLLRPAQLRLDAPHAVRGLRPARDARPPAPHPHRCRADRPARCAARRRPPRPAPGRWHRRHRCVLPRPLATRARNSS